MNTASNVSKLYKTVVEDVINNVKEAFLDEGVDEQVLQELRQLWDNKLAASKALDPAPQEDPSPVIAPGSTVMLPQQIPQNTQPQGATAPTTQVHPNTQFQPTSAAQTATLALPQGLFQQQIAALGAGGQIQNITVKQTGNGQFITLAGLPAHFQQQQQVQQQQQPPQQTLAQQITPHQVLHQQQQPQRQQLQQQAMHLPIPQQQAAQLLAPGQNLQPSQTTLPAQHQGLQNLIQIDGNGNTSSSDDDFDDDDKDEEEKEEENEEEDQGEEEEPLNSDDDVSEEDPNELFDTENVVVCQYDKINRNKNKWKFYLKDGIMNLNGRDYVFQKASGDSEW